MSIEENLKNIHQHIPANVKLVCVSKFHPVDAILQAYNTGERAFGENRPQELVAKVPLLPSDIEWHFIGNLQTNKVKMVVPVATLIHSISSTKLIEAVEKESAKINKISRILLELHVSKEDSKQGFFPEEIIEFLNENPPERFPHLLFCGIMAMATNTDNEEIIRNDFKTVHSTFDILKNRFWSNDAQFKEISMGMSGDYHIAIAEGATMVRIGTSIFGPRQY